jgi:hypothetical protein
VRKLYRSPSLVEYGLVGDITLGSGGSLPDIVNGVTVNADCPTQTFTGLSGGATVTFTRTSCQNTGSV